MGQPQAPDSQGPARLWNAKSRTHEGTEEPLRIQRTPPTVVILTVIFREDPSFCRLYHSVLGCGYGGKVCRALVSGAISGAKEDMDDQPGECHALPPAAMMIRGKGPARRRLVRKPGLAGVCPPSDTAVTSSPADLGWITAPAVLRRLGGAANDRSTRLGGWAGSASTWHGCHDADDGNGASRTLTETIRCRHRPGQRW